MSESDKYKEMRYEELADLIVPQGISAPRDGLSELIRRGADPADYLLKYILDSSYWFSDSFHVQLIPTIAIGILACVKRRDLWKEMEPFISDSYDLLDETFGELFFVNPFRYIAI